MHFDALTAGETIREFLDNYPGVSRAQGIGFLREASRALFAKIVTIEHDR